MNKLKELIFTTVFLIAVFAAMQIAIKAQTIELDYDFHRGTLGWTAGFADYPPHTDPEALFMNYMRECAICLAN